jgi:hypothetical protein
MRKILMVLFGKLTKLRKDMSIMDHNFRVAPEFLSMSVVVTIQFGVGVQNKQWKVGLKSKARR